MGAQQSWSVVTSFVTSFTTRLGLAVFALFCLCGLSVPAAAQDPGCPEINGWQMATALGAPELAGMTLVEIANCDGLLLSGNDIGFRLYANNLPVHGGIRSEVSVDYPFAEGDTVQYRWEMRIPANFSADAPLNRWWLLAQWHDQPDRRIGEKWANFPARSPPLAIYLEVRDSVLGIGIVLADQRVAWMPVPLGVWLPMSMTVEWHTGAEGKIAFAIGGYPQLSYRATGRNMNNTYQHYLKLGQYRHSGIKKDSVVFFRNLRITSH